MKWILDNKLLLVILLFGLLFRVYNFEKGFSFAHDQDLYSWIAKDIVVNGHIRSVGQITSVDGVFIGPFYYYLMALFYWIFNMNPMSAIIPLTLIGLFNCWSFYYLGKSFFSKRTGLIMCFFYAISWGTASFDRWSVPTQPTITWCIWFLYLILAMLKRKIKVLPLYGLLIGFLWHIHIALLPIAPIPIVAYFLSNGKLSKKIKKIGWKNLFVSILLFFIVSAPFWFFEIKHHFSQFNSVIMAMKMVNLGPTGYLKLIKVLDASASEIRVRVFNGWNFSDVKIIWLFLAIIYVFLQIVKKIPWKQSLCIWMWIFLIFLAQFTSKKQVSEYYFTNLVPIYILFLSIFVDYFLSVKYLKYVFCIFLFIYFGSNIFWLRNNSYSNESYFERKQLVDYIKSDVTSKKYPCIAINYISSPGTGVGFRYLFWYYGVKLIRPNSNIPIYNIIIPWNMNEKETVAKFGRFGVIPPDNTENIKPELCDSKSFELDPLLGYTE